MTILPYFRQIQQHIQLKTCGPRATTVGYIDPGLLHYVVMNGYVALYIENNKMCRNSNQYVFVVYTQQIVLYIYTIIRLVFNVCYIYT